jgi:hypothetical protein
VLSQRSWAGIAMVLALSACSGDPEPKFEAEPPARTDTPETVETTSVTPTAAPQGPEDVVRAWVEAQTEALSTGNTATMKDLAAIDCRGCSNFASQIDGIYAAGGHIEGGTWELVSTSLEDSKPSVATVSAAVRIAAGQNFKTSTSEPIAFEASSRLLRFKLKEDGTTWRVSLAAFVS